MSLRRESLRAYRALWRSASLTAAQCACASPHDDSFARGLQRYIADRFARACAAHRERLVLALHHLQEQQHKARQRQQQQQQQQRPSHESGSGDTSRRAASSSKSRRAASSSAAAVAATRARRRRAALLRQYELAVSQQIDHTHELARVLPCAVGDDALTSLLRALAANVGNSAYQQALEQSYRDLVAFAQKRAERDEATAEATSERQNRIMQTALRAYAERLLLLHRTALGERHNNNNSSSSRRRNRSSTLTYLTPWQATEAIVGTRSGVAAHHVKHGHEHVIVEVDEPFNKQVVYICRARARSASVRGDNDADDDGDASSNKRNDDDDGSDDGGSYDWSSAIEGVDVSESEEVQRTLFHTEFLHAATQLCDALTHETPLHAMRKTVLVGHGVGGALAVIVALLLLQRGFDVNNVVTLGAPKALQHTLARYVAAINPIRVVLDGDPLVDLPVSSAEGEAFVHIGEILLLTPSSSSRDDNGDNNNDDDKAERDDDVTNNDDNDDDDDDDDDKDETSMSWRVAARRYRRAYLVEHYVRHLCDANVQLTYAEGDDAWDDGETRTRLRRAAAQPYMHDSERRQRERDAPL